MSGTLFVVGTPLGNLSDMSPRAIESLRNADFIAAEDTRVTIKLLNHFNIKKPMISYFEHNKRERSGVIIERLECGENCALVSDAGMPAISDPGEDIVKECAERGINVTVIPGPSAVIAALALSGLPTGRFTFEGFLSMNKNSRREHLEQIRFERRTMVFYEAPHKLLATMKDMLNVLGDRKIAIVREITKIYEEAIRTTLSEAISLYSGKSIKGEIVLVISGAEEVEEIDNYTIEQAAELAQSLIEKGCSASDAAKQAAKLTGFHKGDIYKLII